MTAEELIEKLRGFPPDAEIFVADAEHGTAGKLDFVDDDWETDPVSKLFLTAETMKPE